MQWEDCTGKTILGRLYWEDCTGMIVHLEDFTWEIVHLVDCILGRLYWEDYWEDYTARLYTGKTVLGRLLGRLYGKTVLGKLYYCTGKTCTGK